MCSMRLTGCMEKRDERMKRQKEKKPETHICYLCGKLIEPEENMYISEPEGERKCIFIEPVYLQGNQIDRRKGNDRDYRRTKRCNRRRNPKL